MRWTTPLDGGGLTPEEIVTQVRRCGARHLLLDLSNAAFADSSGLRWLMQLRGELSAAGRSLRIVARRGGKVWRNLTLLNTDLDLHASVGTAWKRPWQA